MAPHDLCVTIGILTDCQFRDAPTDGKRMYRLAPKKLQEAVTYLNTKNLDGVFHLGDFIDGEYASFQTLLPIWHRLEAKSYHVLGNHDFGVRDEEKSQVSQALSMPHPYYALPFKPFRVLILDGTDISLYRWRKGSTAHLDSEAYYHRLKTKKPLRPYEGALGPTQLEWLEGQLREAQELNLPVVTLCHFPFFPPDRHNAWNDKEVLALFHRYSCVKACFSGHNHQGLYGVDAKGIHHLTFKAMLDTTDTAYALVALSRTKITVTGIGRQASYEWPLN